MFCTQNKKYKFGICNEMKCIAYRIDFSNASNIQTIRCGGIVWMDEQ